MSLHSQKEVDDNGASLLLENREIKSLPPGSPEPPHSSDVSGQRKSCISAVRMTCGRMSGNAFPSVELPKGYILGLGCGLLIDTPTENIHALIRAAREYGQWPLDPTRFQ